VVNVGGMSMGIQMVTPPEVFADRIVKEMYKVLSKKLQSQAFKTSLRRGTKKILETSLRKHPTFIDMFNEDGKLRSQLGIADSISAMESLVRTWIGSTTVTLRAPKLVGKQISGTAVVIRAIDASYKDVLQEAWSSYMTDKGTQIPWLEWLLLHGQEILVLGYVSKKVKNYTKASRTDTNVIMVKTHGRGWGIPEEYAGVSDNNFATQAVANAMPDILNMIKAEVFRRV
jgi:hypothetical protein